MPGGSDAWNEITSTT